MFKNINEDEFDEELAAIERDAFHLETRDSYALGYEAADFERFLAGEPVPPPELDWWRPWLDRIAQFTSEGKTVRRVRILAEPPSTYQRWLMWADPWHAEVGERIGYLKRSRVRSLPLPLPYDWWLLDDERLIVMRFTDDGEIKEKILTNDRTLLVRHREWRDLAVAVATPAEVIAAA